MSRKRIHEVAKEWQMQTNILLAKIAELGIKGKKAQSSLTDEEAESVKQALGLVQEPVLPSDQERVVSERLVTERDDTAEQIITTKEKVVESRVHAGVIRRRTTRVEMLREPAVVPEEKPKKTGEAAPEITEPFEVIPAIAFELPSAEELPPPSEPLSFPEPPAAETPSVTEGVEAEIPPAQEIKPEAVPSPEPQVSAEAPSPPVEMPEIPSPEPQVSAEAPSPPVEAQAKPAQEVAPPSRILGRVDLKKVMSVPKPWVEAAPTVAEGGEVGEVSEAQVAEKKPKKRKLIRRPEVIEFRDRGERPPRVPRKKRALPGKEQRRTELTVPKASKRVVKVSEVITVGDLARAMGVKAGEMIKKLMGLGIMATINQVIDADTAALVAADFDHTVENVAFDEESTLELDHEVEGGEERLEPRPPVVTIMGHVDHGKTSLLDTVRRTNVTAQEVGGITQHIGAYSVQVDGGMVTFLDTPGHEAFTAMRARGAKVTDLVVLVVAADDGVMPQTVEAINHARAAGVGIIVAINKIDKAGADAERVKRRLMEYGLVSEEWGGETIFVEVSAKTGQGIEQLLEMILLQAEVMELKAQPTKLARGTIVEAKLDRGRGAVATVLVQEGVLRVGDPFVCGTQYGKVRAMIDSWGQRVENASPATPVEVLGLSGVPAAGDAFVVTRDDMQARQVAEHRQLKQRKATLSTLSKFSFADLAQSVAEKKELRVVIKADVQGSLEALNEALQRLSTEEVKLNVLHASVGGVSESDVLLASASNGVIIGFNVRPEAKAAKLAEHEKVEIRLYNVIYDVLSEVRAALEGLLTPMQKEKLLGRVEVRQTFTIPRVGVVAGSLVREGKITRGAQARLVRDQVVVYQGRVASLRRFKEDVREVAAGYECGVGLENFQDLKVGDVLEVFELEQVTRRLEPKQQEAEHRLSA
jgi:translation initiation factor IF-2